MLGHGGNPAADPAFAAGRFAVQDEGSQLVVALLDPQPGERVLDVCAAPGAKATAIAEAVEPGGRVVALDRHARRLALVAREARRLGLGNLELRACDVTRELAPAAPPASFDRVLVDAPCSGLGTLRRNADLRWRVEPGDPAALARQQRALLGARRAPWARAARSSTVPARSPRRRTKPSCAPSSRGAGVPGRPARRARVRAAAPRRDGFLRSFPHRHGSDGFFAARLERA